MHVFYSANYVASSHDFDTTRKAEWIASSLECAPIAGVELVAPPPLSEELLARIHDAAYVRAVRTGDPRELAESQGFTWNAGLWPMVLASNGGVVAAAREALAFGVSGSLSSGLHHARRASGAGYCTFNGLAIAATQALVDGAESVLILDLDAHCGGGTASLMAVEPRVWQVDVSVNPYDGYESNERASLRMVTKAADYLTAIESALERVEKEGPTFRLCLFNAGMDPFEGCSTGGLRGITREILAARERMVFDWCRRNGVSVAFVLAGGYTGARLDEEGLVGLHRLTLSAAAEHLVRGK